MILYPIEKVPNLDNEYVGDIFIDAKPNPNNLSLSAFYEKDADIDWYLASAASMPLQLNGLDAVRFDGAFGMLPSTIVAIRADGRVIEIVDFNERHQSDGIFDSIIASLTDLQ